MNEVVRFWAANRTELASLVAEHVMLVGVAILVPIILAYTVFNYWVFRGRVRPGEGYH